MAGQGIAPGAGVVSQFSQFLKDCGEAAALAVEHAMNGTPLTAAELDSQTAAAIAAGFASPGGVADLGGLQAQLASHGVPTDRVNDLSAALANVPQRPVLIGLADAEQLPGQESGLHGHFVTVLGADAAGFIVADPSRPEAARGQLVHYTLSDLQRAQPFGELVTRDAVGAAAGGAGIVQTGGAGGIVNITVPNVLQTALSALGLSLPDLLWRAGLIVAGALLLLIGLVLLVSPNRQERAQITTAAVGAAAKGAIAA